MTYLACHQPINNGFTRKKAKFVTPKKQEDL